jgi:hypothetical protein
LTLSVIKITNLLSAACDHGAQSEGERFDDFEERKLASATSVVEPPALDDEALIDVLRHRRARSLTAHEREEIDAMVEERPAVDLEGLF